MEIHLIPKSCIVMPYYEIETAMESTSGYRSEVDMTMFEYGSQIRSQIY